MTPDHRDLPLAKQKRRRFQSVSLNWLLPNMLTIAGLISGLTGLRFALDELWISAITMILLSAIFDALDGRMARLLKTTSAFGAALDSLSDAVVFGIVPALTLYLWALQDLGNIAWGTALFYAVGVILRLARFNSELPDKPEYTKSFFVGIPAPAAAFLVLLPVVVLEVTGLTWLRNEQVVSIFLIVVGAGAVSTMPTFNGKTLKVPSHAILPFLALIALIGGIIVISPWFVYLVLAGLYVTSFPFSILAFYRRRRHFEARRLVDK